MSNTPKNHEAVAKTGGLTAFCLRWFRRLFFLCSLLAVLAWFAPAIFVETGGIEWLSGQLSQQVNGSVKIARGSASWLSPVVLEDVELLDARGERVLFVPRIASEATLLEIVSGRGQMGTIAVSDSELQLIVEKNRTNLEEVLAPLLAPSETPSRFSLQSFGGQLRISQAKLEVRDRDRQQSWTIQPLSLKIQLTRAADSPFHAHLSARMASSASQGSLDVEVQGRLPTDSSGEDQQIVGRVSGEAMSFPLALAEILLRRTQPELAVAGEVSGRASGQFDSQRQQLSATGDLLARNFHLAGPFLQEPLALERAVVRGEMKRANQRLSIQDGLLECELGKIRASGELPQELQWDAVANQLRGKVSVDIDLAQLSEKLPKTMAVQPGVRITAGRLRAAIESTTKDGLAHWSGSLATSDLLAISEGREFSWPKPIDIEWSAGQTPAGQIDVERLECNSDFLELTAHSSRDRFEADAQIDLNRLREQLQRFVSLDPWSFGGQGDAHLVIRREGAAGFRSEANLVVKQLSLSGPRQQPWQGDLTFNGTLAGELRGTAWPLIRDLRCHFQSGDQELDLRSLATIEKIGQGPWGPFHLAARGDLTRWQQLAAIGFEPATAWKLDGHGEVSAHLTVSEAGAEWERLWLVVTGLRAASSDIVIEEPKITLAAAGGWQRESGKITLRDGRLESRTLSAQTADLQVLFDRGLPVLTGAVTFSGDLQKLAAIAPEIQQALPVSGQLTGSVQGEANPQTAQAKLDVTVSDFVYEASQAESFREEKLVLRADGTWDKSRDLIEIRRLELSGANVSGNAQGSLRNLGTTRDLKLQGTLTPELARLSPILRRLSGLNVHFAGRPRSPFQFEGSLSALAAAATKDAHPLQAWSASLETNWTSGKAYGFPLGPADASFRLVDGWVVSAPIRCDVSEGRLAWQPNVRLFPAPAYLQVRDEPLLQRVRVTPEMCAGALRYIAPMLAGATQVEGSFSLSTKQGYVLLADPQRSELAGQFKVHSIRLGAATPFVRELAVLLRGASQARLKRESVVDFQVTGERVYHQNLELVFPDLSIRSHGSVGFDGTLSIMLEMPVPPKWVGTELAKIDLQNQTIRLPVGGTLDKPKLDRRALAKANAELLRNASRNVLERELQKGLQKLFEKLP